MRRFGIALLALVLALAIDLGSKYYIITVMDLLTLRAVDVFPPLINFRMGWNEGINFGLFSEAPKIFRTILIFVAIAISLGAMVWVMLSGTGWFGATSAGLLAGGALGNAWDRFQFGAVRDFLNMSCCGIQNPYVFNLADVFIFAGVFGLIYVLEIRKT
ncbi:MAG: signal peptidase II [Pseudomonadota bacterium]